MQQFEDNSLRLKDDRLAVKLIMPENKSSGGIALANVDDKPTEGTVIAVGPGKRNKNGVITPIDIKAGDTVMFTAGTGIQVTVYGETFTIFKEEEIIAVLGE